MPLQPATQPQQEYQHQQQQQQQQQQYTPSVSQMAPQHEQAATCDLPLLLFDLAASGRNGRHLAASAQQRLPSTATPTVSSPQLPHHATLLQPPQHMSHFSGKGSRNSGSPEHPQDLQSSGRCVALALDRLFSSRDAQPTTCIQRRERRKQIQQSLSAAHIPSPSANQSPASNRIAVTARNSWDIAAQHAPLPAASGLYPAPKPASSLPPDTPAALAQGHALSAVLSSPVQTPWPPWPQWQQPQFHLQEPVLQQDVDQAAYPTAIQMPHPAADLAAEQPAEPAVAQHIQPLLLDDGASGHLQGGKHLRQSLCTLSSGTRSHTDPDSPAVIAELPLCSPERMSAASSALYSSPVLLWNSPASSAASLPLGEQGREDSHPTTSLSRPVQQQNSQHQHQQEQQQQQLHPHTLSHAILQDSPQHGKTSPVSAVHKPLHSLDKRNCLTASSHRPVKILMPSGLATVQLADEQGSPHALEQIVLRAKCVLKSLEPACSAAQLHRACVHDRVMPFSTDLLLGKSAHKHREHESNNAGSMTSNSFEAVLLAGHSLTSTSSYRLASTNHLRKEWLCVWCTWLSSWLFMHY